MTNIVHWLEHLSEQSYPRHYPRRLDLVQPPYREAPTEFSHPPIRTNDPARCPADIAQLVEDVFREAFPR